MIRTIFILTKNEMPNIERCLRAAVPTGKQVVVLDSGSTDGTRELVAQYEGAELQWLM